MEALQKKTAEMAQILNRDSPIDPYFKQFNGTTCVEHPGVYEHKYKTSAGFSGAAKLFTRQKITGKWIVLITFDAPIEKLELQNDKMFLIAHQSKDKRMFAVKNTISHPGFILPNMPLEIGFDAKFNARLATNDARVVLYEDCDHFKPVNSIRNSFMRSTVRPYNQWGRNLFTRTTATPTTAVAISRPRVTAPIYQARLEMDVDQCSPYQPAGILPGSGQSRPRWISSVFKSAMRYDYNELLHKSLLFVQAQRSGRISRVSAFDNEVIPWRGDSGLKDGCLEGVDLEGNTFV
jgi:hypothetical protein